MDEKTGLDQDTNYHDYESNFDEGQENAILNGERPEIVVKQIRNVSDDEYRELYNNATPDFRRKHLIKDIDSTPSEVDSERSKWVSTFIEVFQKKWTESFDNLGYIRYSICIIEGSEEYNFIHTIRSQLDDSTDALIEEIVKNGKSKAENKHRSCHSIIACFTKQILITFFQNKNKKPGVVVDPLDEQKFKNRKRKNEPLFNHLEGPRSQNAYKQFNCNGPIDENGQPIKKVNVTEKPAVPDQMHEAPSVIEEQENP